jgi:hypothetical protein
MPFLPTTQIYVTDHALERFSERIGRPISRNELARKARISSSASKGIRRRVFKARPQQEQSTLIRADSEAVYVLAANHRVRAAFWLVTVLSRAELAGKEVA